MIVGAGDELGIIRAPRKERDMFGMLGQRVPFLKCDCIVDHHGVALSASRESLAVVRELEKPHLPFVDVEIENIPQGKVVPVAHVIGKQ